MSFVCPDLFITLAQRLVLASGEVISAHFRKSFSVEEKGDLSPVTIADREAEAAIRRILEAERPQDGIIGEEFGAAGIDKEFQWVIDPIDGTRAFASGKPLFGTLLALLHGGFPVLGVIHQPILNETWIGAIGHPTRLNNEVCKSRNSCGFLSQAVANLGPQAFPFGDVLELAAYRRLSKAVKTTSVGGDCYSYGLVASGHIDVAIEHGLKLYDFAALIPVVEGAGGRMTDWKGNPLDSKSDGHVLALGNPALLPDMVELLEGSF